MGQAGRRRFLLAASAMAATRLVWATYYKDGYRGGRFKNLEVVPIGGRSALASLDWECSAATEV